MAVGIEFNDGQDEKGSCRTRGSRWGIAEQLCRSGEEAHLSEVVRLIDKGGMGAVDKAVHKQLRKQNFAINVLHQKMVENT